jgi:hypothetical protein
VGFLNPINSMARHGRQARLHSTSVSNGLIVANPEITLWQTSHCQQNPTASSGNLAAH